MRTENVIFKMDSAGEVKAVLLSRYRGDLHNIPAYSRKEGFHTVSYGSLLVGVRNATAEEYDKTFRELLGKWPASKIHICGRMPAFAKLEFK